MSDLLNRIRFHCENGTSPYDDVMALNAMLNRKAVRQPPAQIINFLLTGLTAIIEGCADWCSKNHQDQEGGEFDPVKTVVSSVGPLIKTWQNTAMPSFISGCAAPAATPEEDLPRLFHHLLLVISPTAANTALNNHNNKSDSSARARLAAPLAVELFHFAVKFVHESAAKALSCHALRKARAMAQVEGVEAYLAAPDALVAQSSGNGSEAMSMCLSAHMWLSQQIFEQEQMKVHHIDESMWWRCVMQALRLLAARQKVGSSSSSAAACPSEADFRRLPTEEQARCLVLLAHGGVARAVPVAVLFRRLATLGFTGAKPEFMLLTGFGLLSEAPATSNRDVAAKKLVAVYFSDKPAAPLAGATELKAVVEKFVAECFMQRSSAEGGAGGSVGMD